MQIIRDPRRLAPDGPRQRIGSSPRLVCGRSCGLSWRCRAGGGLQALRLRKRAVLRIVGGLFGGLSTDAMPAAGLAAAGPDILQIRSRVGWSAGGPLQGWRYPWGIIVIPTLTNNNPLTPRKTKKGPYHFTIASLSPHRPPYRLPPHRRCIANP